MACMGETGRAERIWILNRQSKGHKFDCGSNVFSVFPEVFLKQKPQEFATYARVVGKNKNVREYRWIKKDYLKTPDNYNYYKVFVPKANGSGTFGEPLANPIIGEPCDAHTVTFLSIGKYEINSEAFATLNYIKTKFLRCMLGTLKVTQDNPRETWANVPLQDFTEHSDIDWSKSIAEIDQQLYRKYNLSDDEIAFIEKMIKPME